MIGEILCVGTELLLGDILNSNSAFLAGQFAELGITCYYQSVVGDNETRLAQALSTALARSQLVVLTGGLGPTYDDITKEVTSRLMGRRLVWNEEAFDRMKAYFKRSGKTMSENNKKQALVPEGSIVLQNENGTAPGIIIETSNKTLVLLPGPPFEMEPMFLRQVKPYLSKKSQQIFLSRTVHLFGIGESQAESRLKDLMLSSKNPTVAPYAKMGEVVLRVTASAESELAAKNLIEPVIDEIRVRLGEYIYGVDVGSLQQAVVDTLKEKKLTAAAAESCTGGGVSRRIVSVPGASYVFKGGVCSYLNETKEGLLGVSHATLAKYGAISENTALEMARGIKGKTGSDIGISVTGVAGPEPSEGKPVGEVFIGVACDWREECLRLNLSRGGTDERARICHFAENHALYALLQAAKAYGTDNEKTQTA